MRSPSRRRNTSWGRAQDVIDPATGKKAGDIAELDRDALTLQLSEGRAWRTCRFRGADPGQPLPHPRPGGRARSGSAAHCSTARAAMGRREHPPPRSLRPRRADNGDSRRWPPCCSLDGRHLVIQGPPGSGKTWTSGRLIARLLVAGKTVGVASTSHRAIHKLLAEVEAGAAELGLAFQGVKKASGGNPELEYTGTQVENVYKNEETADAELLGGTAWLFSDPELDGRLDYLFVDEAGQVSLADACAMAPARTTWCSWATRSSSARCCRARTPTAPRRRARAPARRAGDDPADRGLFLERHLPPPPGRPRPTTSPRSSTNAACCPTWSP